MEFAKVFENEHAIVVDKPANCLTTPARDPRDARPVLGRAVEAVVGAQIYPVHRLDYEVSGLVIFAKHPEAHRAMQAWFERGEIVKTYEAASCVGQDEWPREWTEWRSTLAKGKRRAFLAAHGKPSVTRARARRDGEHLLWELQPRTGRPHQLRFEMSHRGWPIEGDVLYGGEPRTTERGIALRARTLDLEGVGERFGLPHTLETGLPEWWSYSDPDV